MHMKKLAFDDNALAGWQKQYRRADLSGKGINGCFLLFACYPAIVVDQDDGALTSFGQK